MARSSRPPLPALDTAPGVTRSNCSSYRWRTFPVCWLRCSCAACDGGRMWRQEPRFIQSLHMLALLTAVATFPLIFMGGLVTSHAAGMSVPDWPNSYGYNMFLFPPRLWIGGILYEHTHRLMGTVVGFLSLLLTLYARRAETPALVRWLATRRLGAVIFQGVLGGLRVIWVQLDLAIVHACFAQAFFCLAAFTAVVTSKWWLKASSHERDVNARRLITLAVACCLAI